MLESHKQLTMYNRSADAFEPSSLTTEYFLRVRIASYRDKNEFFIFFLIVTTFITDSAAIVSYDGEITY